MTDFDIRRNGTSFAAMRFAAGADTVTFIAVADTVLGLGDMMSVIAPVTPDATLVELGFTLAATLVL